MVGRVPNQEPNGATSKQGDEIKVANDRRVLVDPSVAGMVGIGKRRTETLNRELGSISEIYLNAAELDMSTQLLGKFFVARDVHPRDFVQEVVDEYLAGRQDGGPEDGQVLQASVIRHYLQNISQSSLVEGGRLGC